MKLKKTFAVMAAAGMLAGAMPVLPVSPITAYAAETVSGNWNGFQWNFDEKAHTLYIRGTGAMPEGADAYGYEYPWETFRGNTSKIVLQGGITHISSYAFRWFTEVTDVELPPNLESIGSWAFQNTKWVQKLKDQDSQHLAIAHTAYISNGTRNDFLLDGTDASGDVFIPYNVDVITEAAFYGNHNIKSVVLPLNLKRIDNGAFCWCDNLRAVINPAASELLSIGDYAFQCTGIQQFDISNKVETVGVAAFSGCSALEYVTIPKSVRKIGTNAFVSCKLNYVYIQNPKVVIGLAFDTATTVLTNDLNNDGKLTSTDVTIEKKVYQAAIVNKQSYTKLDTNNDGKLDAIKLKTPVTINGKKFYYAVDADGDGKITSKDPNAIKIQ